ncbi:glycosyltransferase [Nitrosophilus alvini]|uniref:glycosyltransferase n=1 Tax=Nitrosophilus alvini TaxID=2714855 RepID=UPI00190913FE|nr:glycosyltransferase [Nitrosophilus alvini]
MKKKIFFIVPSMRGGGSERVISIILNHLDRSKFEILLALLRKEGKYLDDLPRDIEIIDLDVKQARYSIFKIIYLIKQKKPDIVFSTLGYLNLLISIIKPIFSKKVKFIARESSIVSVQNQQEKHPNLFDFLYKNFYKNFDLIICQSNFMKSDLIKNYNIPDKKMVVINNPIDFDKIDKSAKTGEKLFNNDKINLLAVGRLDKVKGYDLLLKAFVKLDEKFFLTVIGDGEEKENLLMLTKNLGIEDRITFKGFKKNPYKYMAQADLFILTSKYEGFPNVLLEANACGLPVVAFNCLGGTREIIKDGLNGFLVECENTEQLAIAIKKSIQLKWNSLLIKNLVKEKFEIKEIIKRYEKVLENI